MLQLKNRSLDDFHSRHSAFAVATRMVGPQALR